jgi:hypothetical protein
MVATLAAEDIHATDAVRFCVLPLLNVPVAVNCCVVPSGMEGLWGATASETRMAGVTVTTADPETAPEDAETVPWPTAVAVAKPMGPIDTAEDDDAQVTVRFRVEPFE